MAGIRTVGVAIAAVVVVGCTDPSPGSSSASVVGPSPSATAPSPSPPAPATGRIVAEPISTGLEHPATFAVAPDGAIFYGERLTGEIRRIAPETGADTHVFTVPGVVGELSNEQGLVGLAVPPDFPSTPWLYAYASRMVEGDPRDQIVRIGTTGGRTRTMRVVLDVKEASERHNGGAMTFGPDGMLYLIVGESYDAARAQAVGDNAGKVLRLTPQGGIPGDNPFPGSYAYSIGNRNGFGLAFDPATGHLWETENGPECNDELNRIVPGGNYGWGPSESCEGSSPGNTNRDGPAPIVRPVLWYETTIGPTGAAFCDGCGLGTDREGDLFFGSFNTGEIHEVRLNGSRTGATRDTVSFRHPSFVTSIEPGPDGTLYFSDGQGIYRLTLAP